MIQMQSTSQCSTRLIIGAGQSVALMLLQWCPGQNMKADRSRCKMQQATAATYRVHPVAWQPCNQCITLVVGVSTLHRTELSKLTARHPISLQCSVCMSKGRPYQHGMLCRLHWILSFQQAVMCGSRNCDKLLVQRCSNSSLHALQHGITVMVLQSMVSAY